MNFFTLFKKHFPQFIKEIQNYYNYKWMENFLISIRDFFISEIVTDSISENISTDESVNAPREHNFWIREFKKEVRFSTRAIT